MIALTCLASSNFIFSGNDLPLYIFTSGGIPSYAFCLHDPMAHMASMTTWGMPARCKDPEAALLRVRVASGHAAGRVLRLVSPLIVTFRLKISSRMTPTGVSRPLCGFRRPLSAKRQMILPDGNRY